MFCGEQSILTTSDFGEIAAPVKCKRWSCENCSEWRQRCLQARCIEGKPNRFITFTCRRGQFPDEGTTAQAMVKAWRTIVLRWRRLNKWHKCEYIAVFEPHVSGWPHMHILWKGHWIDQQWLSQQGTALLNSHHQSVSKIKDARSAAFYVAKYFSKAPAKFANCKRYWTSKNWPKLTLIDADRAFHNGFPFGLVDARIETLIAEWKRHGKEVWHRKPDLAGWGALWKPPSGRLSARCDLTGYLSAYPFRRKRRGRAPMAREGGSHG